MTRKFPEQLCDYPFFTVRVTCTFCPWRRGRYRLARLAERYGAHITLDELVIELSKNCPRRRARGSQYVPKCHAFLADLSISTGPPDEPPGSEEG